MWKFRGAGRMAVACGVFLAAAVLAGASGDAVRATGARSDGRDIDEREIDPVRPGQRCVCVPVPIRQ